MANSSRQPLSPKPDGTARRTGASTAGGYTLQRRQSASAFLDWSHTLILRRPDGATIAAALYLPDIEAADAQAIDHAVRRLLEQGSPAAAVFLEAIVREPCPTLVSVLG